MVAEGLVHVVATDAHRDNVRPPLLAEARRVLEASIGAAKAWAMVEEHPRAILADQLLPGV